jgi:hypothetical protein
MAAVASDVVSARLQRPTTEPADVSGHVRTPSEVRMDRGLAFMAVAGVAALTALGWLLSYTALRQLALSAGMAGWASALWPLCIDLFVFVATLAAIADRRRGRSTMYAWTLAALYSAATVAGNVVAAGPDHVAQAVHATPAVTMVLAWHLLSGFFSGEHGRPRSLRMAAGQEGTQVSGQTRTARRTGRTRRDARDVRPAIEQVAAWVAELEAAGQRATGDVVAERFGVSDRTGRRMLLGVRAIVASGASG